MLRALNLLARLERQELDRERQAVRALADELTSTVDALATLESRLQAEHVAGWALPGGPGALAAYLNEARRRELCLRQAVAELTTALSDAQAGLRERIAGMKSLELVAENLEATSTAQAAYRAQIELEEASSPK